jgi:tripartite-type tricarboxylate transporter receptor subunit TctC
MAKDKPGLNYGSQGIGSTGHITGYQLGAKGGVKLTHVPYAGGAQMTVDLVAARLDFAFSTYNTSKAQVDDGSLRVLGIVDPQRFSGLPDVPTMAEAGFPEVKVRNWFGLIVRKETPKAILDKLHQEFTKASKNPELIKRLANNGITTLNSSPEDYVAMLREDSKNTNEALKLMGIVTTK